jgi:hypothetical protein
MRWLLLTAAALAVLAAVLVTRTPSFAQLFAYAPVPAVDRNGIAIVNPKTGKQKVDGFCIVWKPGWNLDNPQVEVSPPKYYTYMSFRADPTRRRVTVYQLWAPNIVATDTGAGWYPIGGDMILRTNITVPMYERPRTEWPCSQETWAMVLSHPERKYPDVVITLPGTGRSLTPQEYRERERQMACANPQTPGNYQRCQQR